EIVCRTEQRFQLLQLERGRIFQRKAGGPLKLTDDGMKRAIRVIGRTLEDQMVVGIVDNSLKQGVNDTRFAHARFARKKDDLTFSLLCQSPPIKKESHFLNAADEWAGSGSMSGREAA